MKRIHAIDFLRGLASLSVCMFHIVCGNASYISENNWLEKIATHGWLGVEVFFVISGFIIPYSLYTTNYKYKNFKTFLLKRVVRIDPPYLVTIIIVVSLNFLSTLSPYYRGSDFVFDTYNLLLHIGYLNGIFGQPWALPVFWTLAIEFQYYLIVSLLFPLLINSKNVVRYLVFTLLISSSFLIPSSDFAFHFMPLFLLGITTFMFKAKIISIHEYILLLLVSSIILKFTIGNLQMAAGLFSVLFILFFNKQYKLSIFFANISYSLYLIHIPIGGRIINFSINLIQNEIYRSFIAIFAVGFSIFIAWIFYLVVEKPSMRFSKKIKYS